MATRTRKPVPPVEPTDDVAPLVDDPAPTPAAPVDVDAVLTPVAAAPEVPLEVEPEEPPTRFVVAENADLDARAVLARTALADWPGWTAVADFPDGELPVLPAHTEA